jgi:peptidoglycan/LPS O-acetylase OafA/YrhL
LIGFIGALIITVLDSLKIIAFSNHNASKYIVSNALTCVFCICFFVLLSCIHFPRLKNAYLLNKLKNMSYELYLVQGIGQCTFIKMYFCDIVLVPISNLYCAIACSVVLDILLAIGLHYLSTRIQGIYE